MRSQIVPSGHGYQTGLPNARDAGFEKTTEGDITTTPVTHKVAQLADDGAWEQINAQLYEAA